MKVRTTPNYPRPEVKAFGERVSEAMYDASIRYSMGGLGGCPDYEQAASEFVTEAHAARPTCYGFRRSIRRLDHGMA